MGQTAAAGVGDLNAVDGTLVTGDGEYLHHCLFFRMATQRHGNPLADNGPFFIDTAAEVRLSLRNDDIGQIHQILWCQRIFIGQARNAAQDIVLHLLNMGIKHQRHLKNPL